MRKTSFTVWFDAQLAADVDFQHRVEETLNKMRLQQDYVGPKTHGEYCSKNRQGEISLLQDSRTRHRIKSKKGRGRATSKYSSFS